MSRDRIINVLCETPRRRSLRLKGYDYSQPGAYFITLCTYRRRCILGEVVRDEMKLNNTGRLVEMEWLHTTEVRPYINLDAFVVMPNHFHAIFFIHGTAGATHRVAPTGNGRCPGPKPASVSAIVGQFKSRVTKEINLSRGSSPGSFWQRNYYEHLVRDEEDLNRIREYIQDNPRRWQEDENNPENLSA
jgi:putative transposase